MLIVCSTKKDVVWITEYQWQFLLIPGYTCISISRCWWTRATRCIMANMLQTKADAHCDKLATKLSWQRLQRLTFLS